MNDSNSDFGARSLREAEILRSHLESNGFDLISPLAESQSHLSYPSSHFPNQALILDENENIILQCNDTREKYSESTNEELSGTRTVEGNIVYVNFGRNEDFQYLDSEGITVSGNIVLMRAGGVMPLDMVNNALSHKAEGILIYLDPQQKDVKLPLLSPSDLAKLQILHGNQIDKWRGSVPLLEISSSDAEKIFTKMAIDEPSSKGWRGELKCTYPIGPGFSNPKWKMRMEVNTVNTAKTYFDVLGAMRGSQEPDRFVMVTNERTPTNKEFKSTSILMEIIRVLGELRKQGWRPHRSIVIAFWGMEGCDQYITLRPESMWTQLIAKTVTYLKVDSSFETGSDTTLSTSTPILEKVYLKATNAISMKNPIINMMLPLVSNNLFLQYGIPFLTMESFNTITNDTLKEVTSFWGVMTWNIADNHGLPFSLDSYTKFLTHSVEVIRSRFKTIAQKHTLFLDTLFQSVEQLISTIRSFEEKWSHADKSKSIEMRIMNDQLLSFAHSLTCNSEQAGATNTLSSGHLIFSKSYTGNDEKAGFGGLQDLLQEITSTRSAENVHQELITLLASLVDCLNLARYALMDGLETFITTKLQ